MYHEKKHWVDLFYLTVHSVHFFPQEWEIVKILRSHTGFSAKFW